jgi:lipoate-protein ligase A
MAIDEALFRECQKRQVPPTLRFYTWRSPAVTFGYFQDPSQDIDLAACERNRIDVVRRPTGGKAVLHEHDLAYALVAADIHPSFVPDILGTYRIINSCLARGLALLGLNATMCLDKRPARDDGLGASCFSSLSRFELLADGRKLCGSAQVRAHGVFLQHGSILLSFDPEKTATLIGRHHRQEGGQAGSLRDSVTSIQDQLGRDVDCESLRQALIRGFELQLGICLREGELSRAEEMHKKQLLWDKYKNERWNRGGGPGMQGSS